MGSNYFGQLGKNTSVKNIKEPAKIEGLENIIMVSGGFAHSFAVLADGTLRAWGRNNAGQLGTGGGTDEYYPLPVTEDFIPMAQKLVLDENSRQWLAYEAQHVFKILGDFEKDYKKGNKIRWILDDNDQIIAQFSYGDTSPSVVAVIKGLDGQYSSTAYLNGSKMITVQGRYSWGELSGLQTAIYSGIYNFANTGEKYAFIYEYESRFGDDFLTVYDSIGTEKKVYYGYYGSSGSSLPAPAEKPADGNPPISEEISHVPDSGIDTSGLSSWAEAEVEKAVEYNLVCPDILSNYQQNISREEFSRSAVKLYEALTGKTAQSGNNPFNDTDSKFAIIAYNLGIINGVGGGRFAPIDPVTRQDLRVMILRALKAACPDKSFTAAGNPETFKDEDLISGYAKEAVRFCSSKGIVKGSNENMAPQGNVTREQAMAMVVRAYIAYTN